MWTILLHIHAGIRGWVPFRFFCIWFQQMRDAGCRSHSQSDHAFRISNILRQTWINFDYPTVLRHGSKKRLFLKQGAMRTEDIWRYTLERKMWASAVNLRDAMEYKVIPRQISNFERWWVRWRCWNPHTKSHIHILLHDDDYRSVRVMMLFCVLLVEG